MHQILWQRRTTAMQRGPLDQKSKPEVNSRDAIKWMSGTKGRRSRWLMLNQIWYRAQASNTTLLTWRNVPNSPNLKIQDGGGRHIGFRKISIIPIWIEYCTKLGGQMHHSHRRKQKTKTRKRKLIGYRSDDELNSIQDGQLSIPSAVKQST